MTFPAERPTADIRTVGGVVVARLLDKRVLGVRAATLFDEVLGPIGGSLGEGTLVLDFSPVTFFGSESFGRLTALAAALTRRGGRLVVCHLTAGLKEAFRVTRLDTTFDVVEDLVDALGGDRPTDAT
ncbi:MAG: STAS domain-containing protein [Planctomycetaceae bacterium]